MVDESVENVRDNLKLLPDEELVRIARGSTEEYRQEALDCASTELLSRGVDIDRYPILPPLEGAQVVPASDSVRKVRPTVRFPTWWFWSCLAAAIAVAVAMLRNPQIYSGKPAIYMLTVVMDLIVLADLDLLFDWRNQKAYFKSRQGWQAFLALAITFWSFLCLFGVVNY
jgi:hypothetical protein